MKLQGEYTFDAPQHLVWEAVQDPDVLGSVLPGGEGVTQTGENEYESKLKIKVGPVQGKFTGNIKLSNISPPNSYDIEVDGKGAPGFVKANGSLSLTGQSDATLLTYQGEAKVGGRIASVGQRLLDASAKSIIKQSLEALNAYLQVQVAKEKAAAGGEAAAEEVAEAVAETKTPEYVPPTQTELAVNVAKDVAGELIPAQYRLPLIIGGIILVLVIFYFIFF
ncbi:MAG: carbon monoxide dehydrogenase subunit G [Ardenticatenaceae bacterium]|nr:carbon monoxide dehydrogenase subunit G [Ardenticatenaceae bacterium]